MSTASEMSKVQLSRPELQFFDEAALVDRLSRGLRRHPREVVFVVGSPFSAPVRAGDPGVPAVDGIVELIRNEFLDDASAVARLESDLQAAGEKRYQAAFEFLQGRRGQQTANEIVRNAVLSARLTPVAIPADHSEECCRMLDDDGANWAISPGTEHLGRLIATYPETFGKTLLTTNFDPLLEVAISRFGGQSFRTILQTDGNLQQTEAQGCHVVHLHGYWHGFDTLHTVRQLGQSRPRLKSSLSMLLRNKLIVVCGYGGWDDVFTESLVNVLSDDGAFPEILWSLHSREALSELLAGRLEPGINRGRLTLYCGINCHSLFPSLWGQWQTLVPRSVKPNMSPSNPVSVTLDLGLGNAPPENRPRILEGDEEDRPPVVDFCVGRDSELSELLGSHSRAVFLTGIGGQGKSTLAAKYFNEAQSSQKFEVVVWRDCKEETDRFENQLTFVVDKLSNGAIPLESLTKQSSQAVIELLLRLLRSTRVLFVFDNVDHYVDLDRHKLTGTPQEFVESLLGSGLHSQAVFTCRPEVLYDNPQALSLHLQGLSLESATELFALRKARADEDEIREAFEVTKGHAFWLDLLALQVAKPEAHATLPRLISEIRRGSGLLPTATLTSIWSTLKEREQLVLRAMAETVKPETEESIGDYLASLLNYNKVTKALKALRALHLVVVKHRPSGSDVLELHPLVRTFVRNNVPFNERLSFMQRIILVYERIIGTYKAQLEHQPTLATLQCWTENAEIDIAAQRFADAFARLSESADAFMSSPYLREFCRVARLLFESVDWARLHVEFAGFEKVFHTQTEILANLGEYAELDALLDAYATTVPNRDSRFIDYCERRSHSQWSRENFVAAVEWGRRGDELRMTSGVDPNSDIQHTLALAERDSGRPELALTLLLAGRKLDEVIDPKELDQTRDGAHYGNIGRCLQFMGSSSSALVCYQKSAMLVERVGSHHRVLNQAFIRQWIAEVLVARNQLKLARRFFRAAFLKWEQVSPPRSKRVLQISRPLEERLGADDPLDDTTVESVCLDWIRGKSVDRQFE